MIDSHLVRSLRITFLSIGFVVFVIMAVHWIQHVSTARPQLTPRVIAATPSPSGLAVTEANGHLRTSSLASFVLASTPATSETPSHTNSPVVSPDSLPATTKRHTAVDFTPAAPSLPAVPSVPSEPTLPPESNGQRPVDRTPSKHRPPNPPHIMHTPRDY